MLLPCPFGWFEFDPFCQDGNSVLQSIINTVEWRESRGIWRLVTNQNARKARLWECLQSGICFTAGCDKSGRPSIFVNPAAIATIRSSSALNAVPDLVLYTVERAEVSAVNSGRHGKGMVVYIDCAGMMPSLRLVDVETYFKCTALPKLLLFTCLIVIPRLGRVWPINPSALCLGDITKLRGAGHPLP